MADNLGTDLVWRANLKAPQDHQRNRPVVSSRHAAAINSSGPRAFLSTDTALAPSEIIAIFVRRWQVEVTFSEVRAHLGVETHRRWSDRVIARTTSALMGLYSLVTLWADDLLRQGATTYAAAWYRESAFTFSDAIAAVRRRILMGDTTDSSAPDPDMREISPDRLIRMAEALCFAA